MSDPVPVWRFSVKAALLPTTCRSFTSPRAKRPPWTKPWLRWTSWWTRSRGTYTEQATPCSSMMSCPQVECEPLTVESGRAGVSSMLWMSVWLWIFCVRFSHDISLSSSGQPIDFIIVQPYVIAPVRTILFHQLVSPQLNRVVIFSLLILLQGFFSFLSMRGRTTSERSSLQASPTIPTPPTPSCSGA